MMTTGASGRTSAAGRVLVLLALILPAVAGPAVGQEGAGNPAILDAIRQLQDSIDRLQDGVEAAGRKKRFYLTQSRVDGSQPLTACAAGYHMASLWEIFDPSHLTYDTDLGLTTDDSGSGPPSAGAPVPGAASPFRGWIRTGGPALASGSEPDGVNCNAWTSASEGAFGLVVELRWARELHGPWLANDVTCDSLRFVWCVQD